jgi:hypothetical protein
VTTERYTAVFTGLLYRKKPGGDPYLCIGEEPHAPDGSCVLRRGQPPCEPMGCEISFGDLPEDCKRLVLDVYRNPWSLQDAEGAA